jgi:hypothetical protein
VSVGARRSTRSAPIAGDAVTGACNTLDSFTRLVTAQSGKTIQKTTASQLITDGRRIQAVLVC